jgi:hypothetical protein
MSAHLDTHHKALTVNLDARIFGTLAEIGAGQEVARWFLQAGAASGTVAKTISAYNMQVSDAIYGHIGRYVSKPRLLSMLEHEYSLLLERLDAERGADTTFFVLADTVAARNYAGTNECHGWLGLRFQTQPRGPANDILLHVNLMDSSNLRQQQALGVLGVNLVYGAYYQGAAIDGLLAGLFSQLSLERIEIDALELCGPAFASVDALALGLELVHGGYANAVAFAPDLTIALPSDLFHKRPVVLQRAGGPDWPNRNMLAAAEKQLRREDGSLENPVSVFEMTVRPLRAEPEAGKSALAPQARALADSGRPVLISRYPQLFLLTGYLRRYTTAPVRFVVGPSNVVQILHEGYYRHLMGGVLEAMGRLLAEEVKIYVHPMSAAELAEQLRRFGIGADFGATDGRDPITADALQFPAPLGHLYRYLLEAGWVVPVDVA